VTLYVRWLGIDVAHLLGSRRALCQLLAAVACYESASKGGASKQTTTNVDGQANASNNFDAMISTNTKRFEAI
jgi:hypothetical protein